MGKFLSPGIYYHENLSNSKSIWITSEKVLFLVNQDLAG